MIMRLKLKEKIQLYYLITTLNMKKMFTMKTKLYLIDTNYNIVREFKTQNEFELWCERLLVNFFKDSYEEHSFDDFIDFINFEFHVSGKLPEFPESKLSIVKTDLDLNIIGTINAESIYFTDKLNYYRELSKQTKYRHNALIYPGRLRKLNRINQRPKSHSHYRDGWMKPSVARLESRLRYELQLLDKEKIKVKSRKRWANIYTNIWDEGKYTRNSSGWKNTKKKHQWKKLK